MEETRTAGTLAAVAVKKDGTVVADMLALTEKGHGQVLARSSECKEGRKHLRCGDRTWLKWPTVITFR